VHVIVVVEYLDVVAEDAAEEFLARAIRAAELDRDDARQRRLRRGRDANDESTAQMGVTGVVRDDESGFLPVVEVAPVDLAPVHRHRCDPAACSSLDRRRSR